MSETTIAALYKDSVTPVKNDMILVGVDLSESDINRQTKQFTAQELADLITTAVNVTIASLQNTVNNQQSQLTGKQSISEKNQPNGYLGLTLAGTIDPAFLPFLLNNLAGVWDANANTPTLSNGTGTDKAVRIVSVTGTRNLGAGSDTYNAGNIVVYLNNVWNKVNTNVTLGVTGIVLTTGTNTGLVTISMDKIIAAADYNTVTDDQLAGISLATAANPAVLDDDPRFNGLSVAVTKNREFTVAWLEDNTTESGNGNSTTLLSLGYNSTTAAARWPKTAELWGTITVASTNYDDVVVTEALLYAKANAIPRIRCTGKSYNFLLPFGTMPFPKFLDGTTPTSSPLKIHLDGGDANWWMRGSGSGKSFLSRIPDDQTEAATMSSYATIIENIKFQGTSAIECAIYNFATTNPIYRNIFFRSCGYPMELRWNLCGSAYDLRTIFCDEIIVTSGTDTITAHTWSGATGDATLSQMRFYNPHFTIPAGGTAIYLRQCDTCFVYDGTFEQPTVGDIAASGIKIYNLGNSAKVFGVSGVTHVEQCFSDAFVDCTAYGIGSLLLENIYMQVSLPNPVVDTNYLLRMAPRSSTSSQNKVIMRNIPSGGNFGNPWKLRYDNSDGSSKFTFEDVYLNGNPTTAAQIVSNAGAYINIWDTNDDGASAYDIPAEALVTLR